MKSHLDLAIEKIAAVFKFEHWLRFYFIREVDGQLVLDIPEKAALKLEEEYPRYAALVGELSTQTLCPETSQNCIATFITEQIGGVEVDHDYIPHVLNSKKFALELMTFNAWVEVNESRLEQGFLPFSAWNDLFEAWKKTPAARDVKAALVNAENAARTPDSTTVH